MTKNRVLLGVSGGVDSSVSAILLKEQGYDIQACFMRNWDGDDAYCTAPLDYEDAQKVCDSLNIPLTFLDFSFEYFEEVFKPFLKDYQEGMTPNPDIACNRFLKFGALWQYAKAQGFDWIATGHYAKSKNGQLLLAKDQNKDQTYFLYGMEQEVLPKTLFPLAELNKEEVRHIAKAHGLQNAEKKDSTGICFIGERPIKTFLEQYLPQNKGFIKSLEKEENLGEHDGLWFYTLGQRSGLGIGGVAGAKQNAPWYVVRKDFDSNILWVSQDDTLLELNPSKIRIFRLHSLDGEVTKLENQALWARVRHRAPLVPVSTKLDDDSHLWVEFETPQRALTPGQSIALYQENRCLGGGVVEPHGAFNA